MSPETLSDIDLVELSGTAWQIVDPGGDHEAEEQTWTALLRAGWPPLATVGDLRAHLEEIVTAVSPPAPAVPLRAVAAVMTFVAAHPERRDLGDALLVDALHEAFGPDMPEDVAGWLEDRRSLAEPHRRRHGTPGPRRSGARPSPPEEPSP
jgi:hypothetical protein